MTNEELVVGARVRLINQIGGNTPGDMYNIDPGPLGTVIAVFPQADQSIPDPIAHIHFDEPIEDLDDWDNVLYLNQDNEPTVADFELIPSGFY